MDKLRQSSYLHHTTSIADNIEQKIKDLAHQRNKTGMRQSSFSISISNKSGLNSEKVIGARKKKIRSRVRRQSKHFSSLSVNNAYEPLAGDASDDVADKLAVRDLDKWEQGMKYNGKKVSNYLRPL